MKQKNKKVAVVGAGIAGLACAYSLQQKGYEVVVFEKEEIVGGRMTSRTKDGFIFDLGADHLCNLYDRIKWYCAEFGITWEKMRFLRYGMVKNNEVVLTKHALSLVSKFRLAWHMLRTKETPSFFDLSDMSKEDTDNADACMRKRLGNEATEYIIDSFTSTYQFHRAKEISRAALLAIMRSVKRDKHLWDLHRTVGGMQALPDAFASRLNVRLSTSVSSVESKEHGVIVVSPQGEDLFDAVVLASQAPATLSLYRNPTQSERELLEKTEYAATMSIAFRVKKSMLPDIAVVWVPYVENQKISGFVNESMKGEQLVHGEQTLIAVWLHEEFARSIMNASDTEIFEMVQKELLTFCSWFRTVADLVPHDIQKWPLAMPKFAHGHISRVASFMRDFQGKQGVFLCGDYLNSPWTEGALRCGERVALQVGASLTSKEMQ